MRWIREHKLFSTVVAIVIVLILIIVGSYASGGGSSFISSGFRKAINTIEKPFAYVAGGIKDGFSGIFNRGSLKEQIEELQKENEKLKQSNTNLTLTQEEYSELKSLAKAFEYEPYKGMPAPIVANIIAVDNSMVYREFTISAGSDKGLKKGDPVVDSKGLVGVVNQVNKDTAKISSILDINHSISFMVKKKDSVLGVLKSNGSNKLSGYLIDENANISEGDTLLTSGMGNYPKGITVGKVTEIEYDSDTQLKMVEVKPSANFKSMQKVAVFKK